jgi:hypothetical protein
MNTRIYAEAKNPESSIAPARAGRANGSGSNARTALLQRQRACGGAAGLPGQCANQDNSRLTMQRHSANRPDASQSPSVPPIVDEALRSPGHSLDGQTRAYMESRFGHDFGQVRVHSDAQAAESARAVNALAYTVGQDIVFGAGQYATGTQAGLRLMAHELTHVVQQQRPTAASNDAEARARNVAAQVAGGGSVAPEMIGQAPLGIHADDGKETDSPASGSPASSLGGEGSPGGAGKTAGAPLVGPLKIDSWLIQELIKQGQLSPQMLQLIQSGQIEIKPDEKGASTPSGAATGKAQDGEATTASTGGAKSFAVDFNTLPIRFFGAGGAGLGAAGLDSGPTITPPAPPTPQWVPTGGYFDPLLGYIPRHFVKWTPPSPSAPAPAGEPNWVQKSLSDLKASFDFSDGLTISSVSNPGVSTSIFVSGVTTRGKIGGLGVQQELGWDKSIGLQLSYRDWYLHGTVDPDGKWSVSLSFPNDAPLPVLPWVNDIFREGGVAISGFTKAAAKGPPNLNNLDPLITELTPHVSRMKGAVDAAKGIAKAQPGVNFSLTAGSGPRPGATPSEKPSGFFIGGSFVASF